MAFSMGSTGYSIASSAYTDALPAKTGFTLANHGVSSLIRNVTYAKDHKGEYKQVYRLKLPADGDLPRDYVVNQLPRFESIW